MNSVALKCVRILAKICMIIPDRQYLAFKYRVRMGRKLNLKNPKTFNEKMQWLKLNNRNPVCTRMVDKYEVRNYIMETLGEQYAVELVGGPWKSVHDIDFENLPEQFVLKTTHDSGTYIICKDKSKLNIEHTKKYLGRALSANYYERSREWPYKNVKPQIIAERYLTDETGNGIADYKCMCFNGRCEYIFVCSERDEGLKLTVFDREWERCEFKRHYQESDRVIDKPVLLEKMIEISEKISKDFEFLRVDFYVANERLYIGELTFYPGSGFGEFEPRQWDEKLGDMILL